MFFWMSVRIGMGSVSLVAYFSKVSLIDPKEKQDRIRHYAEILVPVKAGR